MNSSNPVSTVHQTQCHCCAAFNARIETALKKLAENVKPIATEAIRAAMLRNRQFKGL